LRYGVKTDFWAVRDQIGKGGDKLMKSSSRRKKSHAGESRSKRNERNFSNAHIFRTVSATAGSVRAPGRHEIRIARASSAKEDELQAYKKITGIGPYLDAKTSSDDVSHSKPDPDIFLAARRKVGVDPGNIIAVGDTPCDAESAGRAGMEAIALLCGGGSTAKLQAARCVAVAGPCEFTEELRRLAAGCARAVGISGAMETRRHQ
jgi:beta-phosphoglucomutase-like phosphatase (HAD superfamily)